VGQSRAACTIIAKNYFAAARTLAQSFLARHPGDRFYVLVVDDFEGYIDPAAEGFEVVSLSDLRIPDEPAFRFKYNIIELCTAAKARFLEYLVEERGVEKLFYIDPDILVTGSLEGLFRRLDAHDIVLTPHLEKDFPEDGLMPDDSVVMTHGIYNLGFIGLNSSANARAFLAWWKGKLYDKCIFDVRTGYFVDQKFIDLVPGLFPNVYVERDPGYNVAWWNLHSRTLGREGGGWTCNGGPLYFYHFSNYRLDHPERITRYTTRHTFETRPDIRPLFEEYRRRLVENGHERSSKWPYTYDYFETGERILPEYRLLYRQSLAAFRPYGDPFKSAGLRRKLAFVARLRDDAPFSGALVFAYKVGSPFLRFYRRLRGQGGAAAPGASL
jgi:hypothetical protein